MKPPKGGKERWEREKEKAFGDCGSRGQLYLQKGSTRGKTCEKKTKIHFKVGVLRFLPRGGKKTWPKRKEDSIEDPRTLK